MGIRGGDGRFFGVLGGGGGVMEVVLEVVLEVRGGGIVGGEFWGVMGKGIEMRLEGYTGHLELVNSHAQQYSDSSQPNYSQTYSNN